LWPFPEWLLEEVKASVGHKGFSQGEIGVHMGHISKDGEESK
jgi:hypothetical protein